jgi:hypothetical protein
MSISPQIIKKLEENDPKLTEISISSHLSDDAVKMLCKAIDGNTCLKSLELGNAKISSTSAGFIANLLKKTNAIETLYLRGNEIKDEGARHLADALTSNNCLKHLYLGGNQIKLAGIKSLSESLTKNDCLETIYLRNNFVSDEGAKIIADNLVNNFSLKVINLANTEIKNDGCGELTKIFDLNLTLKEIVYEHNEINDQQVINKLEEKIKYNNSDNVILSSNVAKKIFKFCLDNIESHNSESQNSNELANSNINSQISLNNSILTRSEQYNCFGNHNFGNSILCFGILERMISQPKYQNSYQDFKEIIKNNFSQFLAKLDKDLKDEKVKKPSSEIIDYAKKM